MHAFTCVLGHYITDVGRRAVNVNVVATHALDEVRRGPHTYAPVTARVLGALTDLIRPIFLSSGLPKVFVVGPFDLPNGL